MKYIVRFCVYVSLIFLKNSQLHSADYHFKESDEKLFTNDKGLSTIQVLNTISGNIKIEQDEEAFVPYISWTLYGNALQSIDRIRPVIDHIADEELSDALSVSVGDIFELLENVRADISIVVPPRYDFAYVRSRYGEVSVKGAFSTVYIGINKGNAHVSNARNLFATLDDGELYASNILDSALVHIKKGNAVVGHAQQTSPCSSYNPVKIFVDSNNDDTMRDVDLSCYREEFAEASSDMSEDGE